VLIAIVLAIGALHIAGRAVVPVLFAVFLAMSPRGSLSVARRP